MSLRSIFALLSCIFSCSVSYGLTCNSMLGELYFMSATIQTNAVMCRYIICKKTCIYSAYYIDGQYQPELGNWQLTNRHQYACSASVDGNSFECQFKIVN